MEPLLRQREDLLRRIRNQVKRRAGDEMILEPLIAFEGHREAWHLRVPPYFFAVKFSSAQHYHDGPYLSWTHKLNIVAISKPQATPTGLAFVWQNIYYSPTGKYLYAHNLQH
jgi:hypothetical protein